MEAYSNMTGAFIESSQYTRDVGIHMKDIWHQWKEGYLQDEEKEDSEESNLIDTST